MLMREVGEEDLQDGKVRWMTEWVKMESEWQRIEWCGGMEEIVCKGCIVLLKIALHLNMKPLY